MKRIYIIISILTLLYNTAIYADNVSQHEWIKKVSESIFTIKTFDKKGNLLESCTGFYVGNKGEAISCFYPFVNASKAIIIDHKGKESQVDYLLGANETFDVVKFHVNIKKSQPLTISKTLHNDSTSGWIVPYNSNRKKTAFHAQITKTESFKDDYIYYTLKLASPYKTNGCPLLNSLGEVIGIYQVPNESSNQNSYAVSASFANNLQINGLSINDHALKSTYIKKALPDNEEQAILSLYLGANSIDSISYIELIDDFINKFPISPEGYLHKAQIYCDANQFDIAEENIQKALGYATKKEDVHYSYAKMIFAKELYKKDIPFEKWNIDRAIEETNLAYKINPLPIFKQLKGQILYSQHKYEEAFETYKSLTDAGNKTAELFFEQARCKEMLKDSTSVILLLDSAVSTFSKPYLKEAAPYLFARAQALTANKQYRKAVVDYNEYEKLMGGTLNANFYYIRYQIELEARLYQLALNDITKAIQKNPKEPTYYAEKALLEIRVNRVDYALETSQTFINLFPDLSDGYLFLGLSQCLNGNKKEGINNLQKAVELGNDQAQQLIEKYK